MGDGNYTTSRIVLLGAVGVMCAMTWTIVGTVVSGIVLVLLVEQTIFGSKITRCLWRKLTLRNVYDVGYAPELFKLEKPNNECIIQTSPQTQLLKFNIKMHKELNISFIRCQFSGYGKTPEIETLYDWFTESQSIPHDVVVNSQMDGSIVWEYVSPKPKFKDTNITIGIKCKATELFEGYLHFRATFKEIYRVDRAIRFRVVENE